MIDILIFQNIIKMIFIKLNFQIFIFVLLTTIILDMSNSCIQSVNCLTSSDMFMRGSVLKYAAFTWNDPFTIFMCYL